MRHDISSAILISFIVNGQSDLVSLHWLFGVCLGKLAAVDLGYYLIRDYNGHTKLYVSLLFPSK
jgi:hypothetical protein